MTQQDLLDLLDCRRPPLCNDPLSMARWIRRSRSTDQALSYVLALVLRDRCSRPATTVEVGRSTPKDSMRHRGEAYKQDAMGDAVAD